MPVYRGALPVGRDVHNGRVHVVLISTYDLGRQPFGLASPAAWLRRAGHTVRSVDTSRDKLTADAIADASLIAFYLPMHTATRLALPVIDRVRAANPNARIAAYGLYATLNDTLLRRHGVSIVLGPEAEQDLVDVASTPTLEGDGFSPRREESKTTIPRLNFVQPDRQGLPA